VLLSAEGEATLQQLPNRPANKGQEEEWIETSVEWMREAQWITEEEAPQITQKARTVFLKHQISPRMVMMEFFEGSRTVGRGLEEKHEGLQVVGVDRRGKLYTGTKHGVITAAVEHDLGKKAEKNQFRTVAKKVGVSVDKWVMAWLSPECTPMVPANAINQSKGAAHGRWAQTDLNKANAAPGRVEAEEQYLRETTETARMMFEALEEEPGLSFALEHPANSDLWRIFGDVIRRNPQWRLITVDQCAYGRMSQKPTRVLTNVKGWQPEGLTGTGRCVVGKCAGTKGNRSNDRKHKELVVATDPDRRMGAHKREQGTRKKEEVRQVEAMKVQSQLAAEILEKTDQWLKNGTEQAAPAGAGAPAGAPPPRGPQRQRQQQDKHRNSSKISASGDQSLISDITK
jgi:hypothetical protein